MFVTGPTAVFTALRTKCKSSPTLTSASNPDPSFGSWTVIAMGRNLPRRQCSTAHYNGNVSTTFVIRSWMNSSALAHCRPRKLASVRQTGCLTVRFLFAYALTLWRKAHRYELTHFSTEHGTASGSESLGPVQPRFDRLLWLSRNASALALLPATTTLRQKTGSLPGRCK